MTTVSVRPSRWFSAWLVLAVLGSLAPGRGEDEEAVVLVGPGAGLDAWRGPTGAWEVVGDAKLNPADPKRLLGEPGDGVIINGPTGRTTNLISREDFGDIDLHAEFLVPKGSNSGIKLEGLYEVQIYDSFGKEKPTASDNGGIYPHAELLPRYHHTDEGYPPRVNASKPPGQWQTLDLVFRAPRFDGEGKKIANARFDQVVLNGQTLHEDQPLESPTGHAYRKREVPRGPILLQADHGPVAFRNVRVRRLSP